MSSRQPLIGLVAQYNSENPHRYFIHRAYVQAIADAGGVPLIVPPQQAEQLGDILYSGRGVVLTGGVDGDASRYGEQPNGGCGRDERRTDLQCRGSHHRPAILRSWCPTGAAVSLIECDMRGRTMPTEIDRVGVQQLIECCAQIVGVLPAYE